jgi:phosphoribosyl 1,2-cyclic phosphate phosphodiesterase
VVSRLRITILGCGTSTGVPRIGGDWGNCDPNNPKNRRTRCSLLAEQFGTGDEPTRILIDTSPDMREQVLHAGIGSVDGVLYSHPHADHIHGIDDLRGFAMNMRRRVDVYADQQTMTRLKTGFGYCFETPAGGDYPPILEANDIVAGEMMTITGAGDPLTVLPVLQQHGSIHSLGFRIGNIAYSPDVNGLPTNTVSALRDLDVWIVDALRHKPHPSHFSLDEALAWIDRIKPKRAILTHMHVDLDYETLRRSLPDRIEPAFDGMVVELNS